ncbi:MAG: hypothetical protein ISS35_06485 [Kiritimatiellae bacterium]|nr:hypothetical protein [Kiritimatiellia bacterium]
MYPHSSHYVGIAALLLLTGNAACSASPQSTYFEANAIGVYSDTDSWSAPQGRLPRNAVGIEHYQRFSDKHGDFLSADLQARLHYDSEIDQKRWGVEIHNAWLLYKPGLSHGVRAGHFDPAFGLEPVTDTHGTLLQTLAPRDIGYKKDWGIGLEGPLGPLDYLTAAQIGSGMGIERTDGSFLLSSRIGSPRSRTIRYGASALYGEVLSGMQPRTFPRPDYGPAAIRKSRLGLDAAIDGFALNARGEISIGENNNDTVMGALGRLDFNWPTRERIALSIQGEYWSDDPGHQNHEDTTISGVLSYRLSPNITLRTGVLHDISASDEKDTRVVLQLYSYRRVS